MVNRAKTRTLVRWSDDHDKELLLWLQYCCNESGIKIPYARVAQCMGPSFTEGAIIQHLAKIRTKMEDAGLHVPPAQKRGTVTRAASSIYKPKPKSTNAPVPRVRPDIDPSSSQKIIFDEEEEEEEVGQRSNLSAQPTSRRVVKRQSAAKKSATAVKMESDEDDPSAGLDEELYDSDNEYGAKKPRTRKKKLPQDDMNKGNRGSNISIITQENQKLIDTGGRIVLSAKQPTLASYGYAPTSILDGLDGTIPFRGIRRKSAAMASQDDGSDHDDQNPTQNGSDGDLTSQNSQTIKRQKFNGDHNARADRSDFMASAAEAYQDVGPYGTNRSAMPPPALPHAPADYGYTWDNEFMQGPFHNMSLNEDQNDMMSSANAKAFAPRMPADVANFNAEFGSHVNKYCAGAPPYPSHEYHHNTHGPIMSNLSARNDSFASTSTNSTVESLPASWQQPLRSPGFPNPHEAAQVLHQAINTTGADESSFINIFDAPEQNDRVGNAGESGFRQGFRGVDDVAPSDLFVGLPVVVDDENVDYSGFLNTDEFDD